jgi:hypothetical protein
VCLGALVVLGVAHAIRVDFYAGDDLLWLDHSYGGLARVWTEPSALRLFRPIFGTWLVLLGWLGADSPSGLAIAGILVSVAGGLLAAWAFRAVLPPTFAALAATILLIHPARQQHLLWGSAHADALCLAFSLLCIGLAIRTGGRTGPGVMTLCALGIATAGAVLAKEVGLLLPLVVAMLPGARGWRRRLLLGAASASGAALALAASIGVLGGTGRPGGLLRSGVSLLSLAYPVRLAWPGDHGAWLVQASVHGNVIPLALAVAVTLFAGAALFLSCRGRYRQPWAHAGLVLLAAGAIPWLIRQDDRSIGLGCAGLGVLLAGSLAAQGWPAGRRAAVLLIVLALAWSPLWIRWEGLWTEAARTSGEIESAWRQWRSESGAEPLLVGLGSVSMIGPGAEVTGLGELDRCALDLLGVVGPPPVPPVIIHPAGQPGRVRLETAGGSFFRWGWSANPGLGILSVDTGPGGRKIEALFDPAPLSGLADSLGCGAPLLRRWDGQRFVTLPKETGASLEMTER